MISRSFFAIVLFIFSTFSIFRVFDGRLRVYFFDVGQGDAAYIRTPRGDDVVLDAGRDNTVVHALGRRLPFFDHTVETLILTHSDTDHITGAVEILRHYRVKRVFLFSRPTDSPTFAAFLETLSDEHAEVFYPEEGTTLDFGGTQLVFLSPLQTQDVRMLSDNEASFVNQLRFGENTFLFMADVGEAQEKILVERYGVSLESDVLKVGHHGSKYSSSDLFLRTVRPRYGILSVGRDNPYGHPHPAALTRLRSQNIQTFSTAEQGTIGFSCDVRHCFLLSNHCLARVFLSLCPK